MARRHVYIVEGRRIPKELRGQRVLPISTSDGFANVRVLTGPLTPKFQEVPMGSVTEQSAPEPTRHDVLVRVIECAHGPSKCRLCGKARGTGNLAHEEYCPIPVAYKLVGQQAKRLAKAAKRADDDDVDDIVEIDDEVGEDDDDVEADVEPRKTKSRPKRLVPNKRTKVPR
jgi:hypothetical protein